jgi:hypothetical protein
MNLVILDKATEATLISKINEVNMIVAAVYCFLGFIRSKEITFEDKYWYHKVILHAIKG